MHLLSILEARYSKTSHEQQWLVAAAIVRSMAAVIRIFFVTATLPPAIKSASCTHITLATKQIQNDNL